MPLGELIAALLKEESDPVKLADAIQQHAQPTFQEMFGRGHKIATAKHKEKEAEASTQLQVQTDLVVTRDKEITTLKKGQPDLDKQVKDRDAKIAEMKEEGEKSKKQSDERFNMVVRGRARTDLVSALVGSHHLDPDYADVIAGKADGRIRLTKDGAVEVLEAGKDIPLQTQNGVTGLQVLAGELAKGVDPKWLISKADHGSGTHGEGGKGGKKDYYDDIAKKSADRHDPEKGGKKAPTLADRIASGAGAS